MNGSSSWWPRVTGKTPPLRKMKSPIGLPKSCDFAMKWIFRRMYTPQKKWSMFEKWFGARMNGAARRDVLGADRTGPVEEQRDRGEDHPDELVHPARLVRASVLVEARERLGGALRPCSSAASDRPWRRGRPGGGSQRFLPATQEAGYADDLLLAGPAAGARERLAPASEQRLALVLAHLQARSAPARATSIAPRPAPRGRWRSRRDRRRRARSSRQPRGRSPARRGRRPGTASASRWRPRRRQP